MTDTTREITLTVNGTERTFDIEPQTLLVHALRDELGYTGSKVGCESSLCGACTIHVDGRAVKSCTLLAVRYDRAEITTVEGSQTARTCIHSSRRSRRTRAPVATVRPG